MSTVEISKTFEVASQQHEMQPKCSVIKTEISQKRPNISPQNIQQLMNSYLTTNCLKYLQITFYNL